MAFTGFSARVREFFSGLEADNSREYFEAHRAFFTECVRDQMLALLDELAEPFGASEVKLFRQNRVIRFSPDKSPYKTNTYGILRGSPLAAQGLYASISARGLVAGSGYHVMARDQLERYREAVDDDRHGTELRDLADQATRDGLELWGDSLATAPRGYPKDHPRIELLRRRSLALGAVRECPSGISREDALDFVAGVWRSAAPVTGWLDAHVGPTREPVARR
jgi:uncharacterized protein (TIGR02453 family)